jgi:glutamine amidotransferase-like uncharacterized protein
MKKSHSVLLCLATLATVASGCNASSEDVILSRLDRNVPSEPAPGDGSGDGGGTTLPPVDPVPPAREWSTDVLLFAGAGSWSTEVASLESILTAHGATYRKVSSATLDSMSVDDLAKYGLILFPGGSGGTQAGSLSDDTHARLREAVQKRGVSYLGFCAGAFIAFAPAPPPGGDVSYGLGVAVGPVLDYYYLEYQGKDVAMTKNKFADGSTRDLLWYGGPVTPNLPGGVIAKYPNGDPSITQTWSGKGFVIVSGPHPAAPTSVKSSFGLSDSDGTDFALAWQLIDGALNQKPLKAF